MEEKERYVIRYDLDYNRCLIDTEKNQGVGDYIQIVKLLNQQDKENQQLKQQLHDLPKKIVKEVEKNFTEYLPLKYKTGAGFYSRLNSILKKYGGEDE